MDDDRARILMTLYILMLVTVIVGHMLWYGWGIYGPVMDLIYFFRR